MSDNPNKDNRSPEEIQRDIEQTQDKLAADLDELSYRASPEGLKDQATEQLEDLKSVAVSATEEAANEVTHRAEALGEEFAGRLRDNPLPAALIGAAVGVGWLLMRAARDNDSGSHASTVYTDTAAVTTYAEGERVQREPGAGYDPRRNTRRDAGRNPETQTLLVGGAVLLGGAALGLFLPRRRDPSQTYNQTYSQTYRQTYDQTHGQSTHAPYDFAADNAYYRSHYRDTFADTEQDYEHFERAYRFGATLPTYPAYQNRDWAGSREDAKRDWERGNDATWEEVRDAVRYGWERARSYR